MRFVIFPCVFLALVSCASPGRQFNVVEPIQISVGGSDFYVYVLGDVVRVIRTSFEVLPRMEEVGPRAVIAIERVTGCNVVRGTFAGDQAMSEARIDCQE